MKTFVRARKGADRERHFLPPDGQQGCTSRLRGKGRYEFGRRGRTKKHSIFWLSTLAPAGGLDGRFDDTSSQNRVRGSHHDMLRADSRDAAYSVFFTFWPGSAAA